MKAFIAILVLVLASGCVSPGSNPGKTIIGRWTTEIGGFPVTAEYTETTVAVAGHAPVSYEIVDGQLLVSSEGSQPKQISFNSRDEMVLADPLAGTKQVYARVSAP